MENKKFEKICREILVGYYNERYETKITEDDCFTVWICKTLQNNKALMSTTVKGDGLYCEFTYNGDTKELYFDAYNKELNKAIYLGD